MTKTLSTLFLVLLTILISCSQPEKDTSEMDAILEKMDKDGTIDSADVKELLKSMSEFEGTYALYNPKGKFKIRFPVMNVEESTTTQIIDNEEIDIFHNAANMQGKNHVNLAYQLDYLFLPEIKTKEEIDYLFKEQRDYVLSGTNSTLEFEKVISKNGAPGRHLYLTVDDSNLKLNYKMYFKNGIFYKLSVITENGNLFNKEITHFFNSFVITK